MITDAGRDLVLGSACVGCGRAGRVLCPGCETALPRGGRPCWPTPTPVGLACPWAAGEYDDLLRVLVNRHKEHGVLGLAAPLGRVLGDVVADLVGPVIGPVIGPVVLVPVPSRRRVVRSRGHDPLLRVARGATRRLRVLGVEAVVGPVLVSRTAVRDQASLGAVDRAANLAGSMRCRLGPRARERLAASSVVVVDDVLTTGSTAREAQRALEEAGVPVRGIATVAATRRRWG